MTALGPGPTSVEQATQGIAEAALATRPQVQQGLFGTARRGISVADHPAKQIEEINKDFVDRMSTASTSQLGNTYATAATKFGGVTGLASDISRRMQESPATAGFLGSGGIGLVGLAGTGVLSAGFAKQISDIAGVGLAKKWTDVLPTSFLGGEHLKAFRVIEGMTAETKRMEAIFSKATLSGFQGLAHGGVLGAVDQQFLRSPLAAKGFFAADSLTSIFGESSIVGVTKTMADAALGPLAKNIASLGVITAPNSLVELLEHEREIDTAVERIAKRWETSALWFLLSILSVGQLVTLASLEPADVEAVLLNALEIVVTSGAFTATLIATIKQAPSYVTADQRNDLLHGLEHAQGGEFSRAALPLTAGLEGALWSAGRELDVIDADRRLLDKPDKGEIHRVELLVRKLPTVQEFRTFVCGRVFGNVGNPMRHGEQSDRRRQSLFTIVAIAGWIEAFMKVRATDALGTQLSEELALGCCVGSDSGAEWSRVDRLVADEAPTLVQSDSVVGS